MVLFERRRVGNLPLSSVLLWMFRAIVMQMSKSRKWWFVVENIFTWANPPFTLSLSHRNANVPDGMFACSDDDRWLLDRSFRRLGGPFENLCWTGPCFWGSWFWSSLKIQTLGEDCILSAMPWAQFTLEKTAKEHSTNSISLTLSLSRLVYLPLSIFLLLSLVYSLTLFLLYISSFISTTLSLCLSPVLFSFYVISLASISLSSYFSSPLLLFLCFLFSFHLSLSLSLNASFFSKLLPFTLYLSLFHPLSLLMFLTSKHSSLSLLSFPPTIS